jgi:hypothetical protein
MTRRAGPLLSRVAAVAILVLLVAGLYLGAVAPLYAAYQDSVAGIASRQQTLRRYQHTQRQEAALLAERDRVSGNGRTILLSPASDSAAAAELQKQAEAVIATTGARLVSVQTLPAADVEMLRRVGIRVRFTADITALRDILFALEFGKLTLQLDNLSIAARTSRAASGQLAIGFDILAYKSPKT